MKIHVIALIKRHTPGEVNTDILSRAFEVGGEMGGDRSVEVIRSWIESSKKDKDREMIEIVSLSHSIIPEDVAYSIPRPGMR